jgi:hypothetical protein
MVFGAKSMPAAARIEPTYRTAPSRSARRRCSGSTTRPPADFVETANSIRPAPLCQAGGASAVRPLGGTARTVEPAADLHPAAGADQGQAHLMAVFQGAVDATFTAFGIKPSTHRWEAGRPRCGSSPGAPIRSSALARPASTPKPRPSRCVRARSRARIPAISSSSMARPSSSRVSQNGAIPTGSCGAWMLGLHEIAAGAAGRTRAARHRSALRRLHPAGGVSSLCWLESAQSTGGLGSGRLRLGGSPTRNDRSWARPAFRSLRSDVRSEAYSGRQSPECPV